MAGADVMGGTTRCLVSGRVAVVGRRADPLTPTRRCSSWLQTRHHQSTLRPPAVDQLLGCEPGARSQVGEVALRRARPDADARGRISHGTAGREIGSEDVDLAGGPLVVLS